MDDQKTYVAFILDKSGSMQRIKDSIISGFNEHIQTLTTEGKDGTYVLASLVLFSDNVEVPFFNSSVFSLREMDENSYKPLGSTAMYDAVGYTIDRLGKESNFNDPNNSYLLMVFSDGEENASRVWNGVRLAEKIQELQKTGRWTITYVGANQDLAKVSKTLNIDYSNTLMFDADTEGTKKMMPSSAVGLVNYMKNRKQGKTSVSNFYSGD
jgi:uncharacterized protein YegL